MKKSHKLSNSYSVIVDGIRIKIDFVVGKSAFPVYIDGRPYNDVARRQAVKIH